LKILELNFAKNWRGGERQTIYNCQGFIAEKQEVVLLCRKGSVLEATAISAGIPFHSFKRIPGLILFLLLNGHKFDLLHAQTSHILTYCILTKPFHRRKVLFSRRIDFIPKGFITQKKYQLADFRVGVSTAVARIVEQFSQRKTYMISDIAVAEKLNKPRAVKWLEKMGISQSKTIIGTTAALVQHKDPLTLVNAIALVAESQTNFVFLHFGSGGLTVNVLDRIMELGLEKVYLLAGFDENVTDFFSIFDIFVMSSEQEGLGSSVLDAFLYEVPVVSTIAGGLSDLLADGRGISCPIHDSEALARGIISVLNNNNSPGSIKKAYEFVKTQHSMQYISQRYLDLIRRT